jgi:hypothetical protein
MAAAFQQISITDLSKGIDQRSAPNAIPEGYAEDLQNVITNSNGFLSKRPGYEGFYGYLPLRIKSIQHSGTNILFTLDSSINISNARSTPIVVYGKLSSAQTDGDWTNTNNGEYYLASADGVRSTLSAPSDTETVLQSVHGVALDEVLLQINQSTNTGSSDNSWIVPDRLDINNAAQFDIDVTATIPSDIQFFTLIEAADYTHPDQTIAAGATTAITITAGTHGLTNFNIIPNVYYLDGSEYVKLFLTDTTVNTSTGTVVVTITNSGGAGLDVRVCLTAAESANVELKTVASGATDTITISTTEPYNFFALYSVAGAVATLILPDSVVYTASTGNMVVTITNSTGAAESYKFYWEPATVRSSVLTVTDNQGESASYTDSAPQLTMWGISHEGLYDADDYQEGFVNHIDTYRTDTQSKVVAGLGGNIFTATTRAAADSEYKIPTANIDLEGALASDALVAPFFITTGDTADRTNGNVVAYNVVSNKALVTAVTYSASTVAVYTLSLTSKTGSLASVITTSGVEDYLTVTGMANSINNGTFKITAVDNSANTITVYNPSLTMAFDETGAEGRAGIFTDRVTLSANSKFSPGDEFTDSIFEGYNPTVLVSSGTTVVLSGVTGRALITSGTTLYPTRTASVIPLVSSMTNFVKGDMCTLTNYTRKVRVTSVNPRSDVTISTVTGSGTTATVTTSTAHGLAVGDKVLLLRTGVTAYDTEITVVSVINTTSFTFTSTSTSSAAAGVVLGKTVSIDESVVIQDDSASPSMLSVVGRWLPVEVPTSDDNLVKTTYIKHFTAYDYDKQQPLKSTMVQDNLYFTDQANQVMKFDGVDIYQAGLFRWQPQLFAQVDTTTASIPLTGTSAAVSASATNKFTVGTGEAGQFAAGDKIVHSQNAATYIVQSVDTTNNLVYVTKTITGSGSGTLKHVARYKYYFRLNALDYNNNIIASAATDQNDFIVDLTAAGQIHMRLLGMPVWGMYDYDTIELEIYRTQAGSSGPFYRVGVKDVSFVHSYGYIDFQDSVTDEFLSTVDPVSTGIGLGSELGTGWTQPLKAKYITSLDNRLILGNVQDYPELDITLRASQGLTSVTAANLSGKKFRFKKDTTSSATATDMVNIVNYEFVTSGAVTIVPNTDITTTSSSFTVADAAHGLVAGDWVYFFHSAAGIDNELDFAGWFQIASVNAGDFTIDFSGHSRGAGGGVAADVDRYVAATAQEDVPVWIGADGNMNLVGASTINEFTAMTRLASAINATMRMTDTTLASPAMTTFVPWMIASAGNGIGLGRLVVRQEKPMSTTMAVVLPAAITGANVFVEGVLRAASAEVDATAEVFQSRVLLSYRNYPELFDNPFGEEGEGDSVIDINSADGQQITGIVPFFGESVFGNGTYEAVLAVFKTNSIYLVDIQNKQKSKIQSRGLGCTAPGSIASTKDGIMFVNNAGIYRLNRNQTIDYVGAAVERIFQDEVNKDQLSLLSGHHYGVGGQYKLSVPVDSDTRNSQVLVYDHLRENGDGQPGAWTRFTNHPTTGWANLESDAFFGTTNGQVFRVRTAGDSSDYRDDAAAVDQMVILLRANAFGAPGSRKIVSNIINHFQLRTTSMVGTELQISTDLDGSFESAGTFNLTKGATNKLESVKSSLPRRRLNYIQLRYTNSTKDEDVILAGVEYTAALLNAKGINESGET